MQATTIGKNAPRKIRKIAGIVAHAKKDDRHRNPRDRTDRPQNLHHRIHHLIRRRIPAQRQSQRNCPAPRLRQSQSPPGAANRQYRPTDTWCRSSSAMPFSTSRGEGKTLVAAPAHGVVPQRQQQRGREHRPEEPFPLCRLRERVHSLVRQPDLLKDAVAQFQIARRADVAWMRYIDRSRSAESLPDARSSPPRDPPAAPPRRYRASRR